MYVRPIAPGESESSRVAKRISTAICMWCRICHSPASHASASSVRLFQTSFRPSWISCVTEADVPGCTTSLLRPHAAQHQRRDEERAGVERDREGRRQELDQHAGEARTDQRRRRLAERDLGVRLDQPPPPGQLREQHLVGGAADDVLHAAEESDDEQDLDRQRVEIRGDRDRQQRDAASDVGTR